MDLKNVLMSIFYLQNIKDTGRILIICLYVDDLIFTGNYHDMIHEFQNSMNKEFDVTNLGLMNYFLGIKVEQQDTCIFILQKIYTNKILDKFKIDKSKQVSTLVVCGLKLSYAGNGKKIDITYYR